MVVKEKKRGEKLEDKLIKLIDVKSIITISLTVVFCHLAYIGKISVDQYMVVFTAVITYYFARSKNTPSN